MSFGFESLRHSIRELHVQTWIQFVCALRGKSSAQTSVNPVFGFVDELRPASIWPVNDDFVDLSAVSPKRKRSAIPFGSTDHSKIRNLSREVRRAQSDRDRIRARHPLRETPCLTNFWGQSSKPDAGAELIGPTWRIDITISILVVRQIINVKGEPQLITVF